MPAILDPDLVPLVQGGSNIAVVDRHLGPGGEHIQPGDGGGQLSEDRGVLGDLGAQPAIEVPLQLVNPLPGVEHQGFILLEFGHHVALGVGQGLPPHVVRGHLFLIGLADLDVIAENLVVADLESPDSGTLPFPAFQIGDKTARIAGGAF